MTDQIKVKAHYISTWFVIDVLSILPVDQLFVLIAWIMASDSVMEASSILRLSRLIRFARLARLPKILNLQTIKGTMGFVLKPIGITLVQIDFLFNIVYLVGVLMGTVHGIGCYWAHTGIAEQKQGEGWIHNYYYEGESFYANTTTLVDPVADYGVDNIYTDVIYFAIVTISSVGYGDYSPQSRHEKWVVVLIIVIGAVSIYIRELIARSSMHSISSSMRVD